MRGLEYDINMISLIWRTHFLFMDMEVMDSLNDLKKSNHYDNWMYLWETYGDPNIRPFSKDLIPLVAVDSSSDEITPLARVAPTDPIPTTNASDSV